MLGVEFDKSVFLTYWRPIALKLSHFMVLCNFLGRDRALKAIYSWYISPKHALAMNRHILVWANLILGRFRDAVLPYFSLFLAASDP